MKRFLSVFLSIAVMVTLLVVPISANTLPTVTVASIEEAKAIGDEVKVEVSVENNPGFTNFDWLVNYDTERLELMNFETSFAYEIPGLGTQQISYINPLLSEFNILTGKISAAGSAACTKNGTLFYLIFKVKENAPSGEAKVAIDSEIIDNNDGPVEFTYVTGTVNVDGIDCANGHNYGNWQVRTEPKCEESGEKYRVCQREGCGDEDTEEIPNLGHDYDDWETIDEFEHKRVCKNDSNHVEIKEHSDFQDCPECGYVGSLPDDIPTGDIPTGDIPSGDIPSGDIPTGDIPSGDIPSGDIPSGDIPTGDIPTGNIPSLGENTGWEDIKNEITTSQEESFIVEMNGTEEVPAEVFETIAQNNATVEFNMGGGISWTINGEDIPEILDFSEINLNVQLDVTTIPTDVIEEVEATETIQVELTHNGEFGFTMYLNVELGSEYAGLWANLYYFNTSTNSLEFQDAVEADEDGNAKFEFNHASNYVIAIDEKSHNIDDIPTGDIPTGDIPTGDIPTGDIPTGDIPTGDIPTGDIPTGDIPTGDIPTGDIPTGDIPTGDIPTGDIPTGDIPTGDIPTGDIPTGDIPTGDIPTGDIPTGDIPTGDIPTGDIPTGDIPTGDIPTGDIPTGDIPTGDIPTGDIPTGDIPTGDIPTGDIPTGDIPTGDIPSGDIPCVDNDNDHLCDVCGDELSQCEDNNNDHNCDVCDDELSQCEDNNNDHNCDVCGDELSQCEDNNNDHNCDVCGDELSQCEDNDNDHNCDVCGTPLSQCADNNNDHNCDVCGTPLSQCADVNNDNDHNCDICGANLGGHTYGSWTNVDETNHKKECDCGDTVTEAHTWDDGVVTTEPTYTTSGVKTFTCTKAGCGATRTESVDAIPRPAPSSLGGTVTYTVNFETDGGDSISIQRIKPGKLANKPQNPQKEGYVFDGWYIDEDLTMLFDFDTPISKSITLYAKWIPEESKEDENKEDTNKEISYNDVKDTDWFYDAVQYVTNENIMNGVSDNNFAPTDILTRAQLVTVLYRIEEEPPVERIIPFSDVDLPSYYKNAVIWAKQNNIVNGVTDTEFAPDMNVTREQIAAIIYRYSQFKGYDVSAAKTTDLQSFQDADEVSEYAVPAMKYVVGIGLIRGRSNSTLAPKDFATRSEIAQILYNFFK